MGWSFAYAPPLGPGLSLGGETVAYAPWSILFWRRQFGPEQPEVFSSAGVLLLLGAALGLGFPLRCGS